MAGILLDLLAATAGGQITRAEAFLRRFRTYALETRLVIVKERGSLVFIDESADWKVINVANGTGRFKIFRRILWENLTLPQLMRREQLNVYLTFSHYLPLTLGAEIHSIVGVSNLAPFSREAWDVESNFVRLKMWLLRHTIISSAKRADQVIALSNACKSILIKWGIDETKIEAIPNGVEQIQSEDQWSLQPDLEWGSRYILSVSHFYRYKNFEQLVESYNLLPDSLKETFLLVIVGRPYDASYFTEIQKLAARLGIERRVRIVPGADRKTLGRLYRHASIFVFPSLIENSPNILLEAMSYGLPVLAGNIEPMPEFGANGVRYFEVLSLTDLSDKMSEILTDHNSAEELGKRARIRASDFSWDTFTKDVVYMCSRVSGVSFRSEEA